MTVLEQRPAQLRGPPQLQIGVTKPQPPGYTPPCRDEDQQRVPKEETRSLAGRSSRKYASATRSASTIWAGAL